MFVCCLFIFQNPLLHDNFFSLCVGMLVVAESWKRAEIDFSLIYLSTSMCFSFFIKKKLFFTFLFHFKCLKDCMHNVENVSY